MSGDEAAAARAMDSSSTNGAQMVDDEGFQCCVCLDLLYKPIVLACGHISCFWCVHKAMHNLRTSHCALCRQPYNHFPAICQLLHHLLLKSFPVAYKKREKEVLDEERQIAVFSPQIIDDLPGESLCSSKNHILLILMFFYYCVHLSTSSLIFSKENERSIILEESAASVEEVKDHRVVSVEESNLPENDIACMQVSVNDALCALCKELLFQPVVLNCGHVYCKTCLSGLTATPLECPVCQSLHPGEFPNVCLDLVHFLEEQFPREYAMRREKVQIEKMQQCSSPAYRSAEPSCQKDKSHQGYEDFSDAHYGVGCDSCGMYPIVGKRYKCKDCKEAVGFDLCEACYNTSSKLPGRFNQQHTPDHEFVLDDSNQLCKILGFKSLQEGGPQVDVATVYISIDDLEDADPEGSDYFDDATEFHEDQE